MRTHSRRKQVGLICAALLPALLFSACGDDRADLLGPEPAGPVFSKSGNNGGGKGGGNGGGDGGSETATGADVVAGDMTLAEGDAPALLSTCPSGPLSGNGWDLWFGKTLCLIIEPRWSSTNYEPYPLLDDVMISVRVEKGKNGRITHIKVGGQDVDGPDGIAHQTAWIPVAQPVVPTKAGFTLHVHATNVEVWRYDSHLARHGQPVEVIGTVSIGDLVYPSR